METKFYDFKATTLQGKEVSMEAYKGKTVLVVNTASKCGLTPQFEGLEKLNQKFKDKGLVILGFPSNQFANQEPGDEKSIAEGCVINYGVTFPMFAKVDVNGDSAHPLFNYLRKSLGGIFGTRSNGILPNSWSMPTASRSNGFLPLLSLRRLTNIWPDS